MSLLTIIQNVCKEIGLTVPNAVISSSDSKIQQLLTIANKEGKDLEARYKWQALETEVTHTTLAAELQGVMTTIAPGFKSFISETMWDRTLNRPVLPLDGRDWQAVKSSGITGPYSQFRIRGGNLYAIPAPSAGNTWAFEYRSKYWCADSTGVTKRNAWAVDTDIGILDEDLMELGIIWRWLKRKGLDYAEDFQTYEKRVQDAITRDGAKPRLRMGGNKITDCPPDATLPIGSWSI